MEESLISTNYRMRRGDDPASPSYSSSSPSSRGRGRGRGRGKGAGARSWCDEDREESGWSFYIEGLMAGAAPPDEDRSSSTAIPSFSLRKKRRIGSNKRKTGSDAAVDHELEDTATSPVHSPKVDDLNELYMKMKSAAEMDVGGICQDRGGAFDETGQGTQIGFVGKDSNYTELRKRGLCLVPVSTLMNYMYRSSVP